MNESKFIKILSVILIIVLFILVLSRCIYDDDPPVITDTPTLLVETSTPTLVFTSTPTYKITATPVITSTLPSVTPVPSKTPTVKPTYDFIVYVYTNYDKGYLHFRQGPSPRFLPFWWYDENGHPVGGWLPENTELIFIRCESPRGFNWAYVLYRGRPGYSYAEYLKPNPCNTP